MGFIGMLCSTLLEMDMCTCANILVIDLVGRVNCIGVNLSLYQLRRADIVTDVTQRILSLFQQILLTCIDDTHKNHTFTPYICI